MLIGLISDTHIPDPTKTFMPDYTRRFPPQIKEIFRGVDLILHAGDIYDISVLDELERIAPVLAAAGDDDPPDTTSDKRVKEEHILRIDGLTIWLTHQLDGPYTLVKELLPIWLEDKRWLGEDRWLVNNKYTPPDIIVFGHTHYAWQHHNENILIVNPGSPTFPGIRYAPGSVALLTLESGTAKAKSIQLQPPE